MASGTLGQADISAATNTTLFTATTGKLTTFTVSFCNRNSTAVKIRLSISAISTPANAEYLEYDATIDGNSVLERSGLIAEAGKLIVVRSDTANVSACAFGFED